MPLRDIVIFPYMVAPLVVGRKPSILALEDAMEKSTEIVLVTQKASEVNTPAPEDLYEYGTLVSVMQILRLPDETIKTLVKGQRKVRIISYLPHGDFLQAEVEEMEESVDFSSNPLGEVLQRACSRSFENYAASSHKVAKDVLKTIKNIENPHKYLNVILSHLPVNSLEKQKLLEADSIEDRLQQVLIILQREVKMIELEQSIDAKVKAKMGKNQRDYFLSEKVHEIQSQLGRDEDGTDEMSELENVILAKKMPAAAREKTLKEFKKLRNMPAMSAETAVIRNYIDTIISLPWKKKSRLKIDVNKAEKILDADHYGLAKPKERILEYLAVQAQVKKLKGPILCLVGPPGVGKTSICRSIARAMGREFARLSLGGVRDEAEIRGHRRTYVGAMPGKIIQSLQKVGVSNPVFCLDEVDKMSADFRGDPSAALLEVLDPEQNNSFNDHYIDLDYDLSEIFFITTANSLHGIPVPLQDRLEIITLSGYTEEDKEKIAEGFLVPKQLKENGFKAGDINFTSGALMEIIRLYTREAGVRTLERYIASLCRKIARDRQKRGDQKKKYRVSVQSIKKFLGTPRFRHGTAEETDEVGLTTGLAWTEVGGELLQIEATLMPGAGKLIITGKLGDVMQESAQAALSYVRSRAEVLGLADDFYQKLDIHIHVPEGAIPKDGPSAGITLATTLASALTKFPVKHYLAMTGEITLRGRILPIGGLTEKLLAAKRGNITHVLIPAENERDLADVPPKIRNSLTITPVEHMDDVLELALIHEGKILSVKK
ncbi:endopeptidase La [Desulforhopalus vacuolatus]|uniref:endopeptidase La n=1 Tax=Desulforhopalus vacuolatus TaxID=40414 RepID=UPI0019635178|nr:endopeptidase La [Desulforhopalus vacuolatus]MBM9519781.1 endopeptidase La [Desulforhopalus vacuolatus]